MPRARLLYDDRSALLRALAARWCALAPETVEVVGDGAIEGARFVDEEGESRDGATAIAYALGGWRLAVRRRFAGVALAQDRLWAWALGHPRAALRVLRLCFGDDLRPPTFVLGRFLFLRLLGLVHFAAFASAYAQIVGLVGARGIEPAVRLLAHLRPRGFARLHEAPTLLWSSASDGALRATCLAGMIAAALLVFDLAPFFALASCWLLYLSIVVVGDVFFHFQWDALLLEASLCGLFLAPMRLLPSLDRARPTPRVGRFLVRLLVFKLMFLSGWVKLLSRDRAWRSLDALEYHFFTQPLPAPTSRFFAELPPIALRGFTLATLLIELVVPFFLCLPRRANRLAFVLFLALQLAIMASGNYGFFNLLSIAIAAPLLDDGAFPLRMRPSIELARPIARWVRWTRRALAAPIAIASLVYLTAPLFDDPQVTYPKPLLDAVVWLAPFRSVNGYGLFRSMTTHRDEITIYGSDDGEHWLPYVFRWKPGDPTRAPRWTGLHMPRLDWQMWFAALGPCEASPWLVDFAARLGEGEPSVTALLAEDPFAGRAPRFLRATIARYTFERDHARGFWSVGPERPYCE